MKARKRTGGIVVPVAVCAFAALAYLIHVSNTVIETTTYEIGSDRLPRAFNGFRIVQISDLHDRQFGAHQSALLDAVRKAAPDVIAITGDLADSGFWRTGFSPELPAQLAARWKTFFITGNHEIFSDHQTGLADILAQVSGSGVEVLQERPAFLRRNGQSIAIFGIDDPDAFSRTREPRAVGVERWKRTLRAIRSTVDEATFTVLLSHRPEHFLEYGKIGFDVVLTGHAHGGQIRLPFIGAVYAPNQGFFPRFTSGTHVSGRTTMVVSRGLGSSRVPIRFLNRPEIVVVRLRAE